jgi:hypothetical protein
MTKKAATIEIFVSPLKLYFCLDHLLLFKMRIADFSPSFFTLNGIYAKIRAKEIRLQTKKRY